MYRKLICCALGFFLVSASAHSDLQQVGGVTYKNVSFRIQGVDFAAGALPKSLPVSPLDPQSPPGGEWPAHIEFKFPHYFQGENGKWLKPSEGEEPTLNVYPTADFAKYKWDTERKSLQALLAKRSGAGAVAATKKALPLLPVADAEEVLHADAIYLPFKNGVGIRYVASYAQDVAPLTATRFFYTFQGLTADGKYYVAATFPLYTPLFPRQIPEKFDYKAFEKGYAAYRAGSAQKLNRADLKKDFTPSPLVLDKLIGSLAIRSAKK